MKKQHVLLLTALGLALALAVVLTAVVTPVFASWVGIFVSWSGVDSQTNSAIATPTDTSIYADSSTSASTFTPAPTDTPTPTPTAVPTLPPPPSAPPRSTGGLPAHFLTGYWQNFVNGATPLRLSGVSSYYKLVAVAFADADPNTPGGVTFALSPGLSSALGGYTDVQFISDVATLHARGQKVILSIGGGGDTTIDVSSGTNVANFVDSVYSLMQTYRFDGVDIDLEGGLDVAGMTSALQKLSAKVGSRLIITLAPQTIDMQSTSDDYFQLALNIKNILTLVNVQYYNSGTMYGCDRNVYSEGSEDFLTALTCILVYGGLSPSQISIGVPGSPNAGDGYVDPAVVNQALGCLAKKQSCGSFVPLYNWSVASVAVWSVTIDASHSYAFAKTVGPYLNTLP